MSTRVSFAEIRSGNMHDLASVGTIMDKAFDPRFGEAWTQAQCLGMLSLPGVWLSIASLEGSDVGFALARTVLDDGELLLIATKPDMRGRGIGGALLRGVIIEARTRGAIKLHLEVRSENDAIHLYRREGFAKVGERRDYYRGKDGKLYHAQTFARNLLS